MSATNRGTERNAYDFYETPREAIDSFLNSYIIKEGVIFEPSAGNGAIVNAIKAKGYKNPIVANDIQDSVHSIQCEHTTQVDFLSISKLKDCRTIITNPPYSIAEEFIRHCFKLTEYKDCDIIMLLRLNFLESQKRRDFWDEFPLNRLYVLSKRPSFTGKGTDATGYGWFVWESGTAEQRIVVI